MQEQIEQLKTEVTTLKARLLDTLDREQAQFEQQNALMGQIAQIAGFDAGQSVTVNELLAKIKSAFTEVQVEEVTE